MYIINMTEGINILNASFSRTRPVRSVMFLHFDAHIYTYNLIYVYTLYIYISHSNELKHVEKWLGERQNPPVNDMPWNSRVERQQKTPTSMWILSAKCQGLHERHVDIYPGFLEPSGNGKNKIQKKTEKKQTNRWFKVAFFIWSTLYLWSGHLNIPKKNIIYILVFQVPCFFMFFPFWYCRAPVAHHWSVGSFCTHPHRTMTSTKRIVNRQYHIHIIQHLW